jgi:hypothetical protein
MTEIYGRINGPVEYKTPGFSGDNGRDKSISGDKIFKKFITNFMSPPYDIIDFENFRLSV